MVEKKTEEAVFAGGCFWCMVKPFDQWPGVLNIVSGYTGGTVPDPSYEEVCTGTTGHYEAIKITYDPDKISYDELLKIFWQQIDPTDPGGQFYDRGPQYRTAIFYTTEEQRKKAKKSKEELEKSGRFNKPVVTEILPAGPFYEAEREHQYFYKKQPLHYERYFHGSGRADFIKRHWGDEK